MRKVFISMLVGVGLLAPVLAFGGQKHHHEHNRHHSSHSSFELDGDEVIIVEHSQRSSDEVVISKDGDLEINGDQIKTDGKSRKLLKKFYREAVILEKEAEQIGLEAAELATEATSFAAVSVLKALKALTDEGDFEADLADLEDRGEDFEALAEIMEERGEEIEAQADKLVDLADELCDRVSELNGLGWFLDRE